MTKKAVLLFLLAQKCIMGYAVGLFLYVLSPYFKNVLNTSDVSGLFLGVATATLFALFFMYRIIAYSGRGQFYLFLLLLVIIASSVGTFSAYSWLGLSIALFILISTTIATIALDIIVQAFSTDAEDGRVYGAILSAGNLGFLCGPISAGYIVAHFTMSGVFCALVVLYSIIFVSALLSVVRLKHIHHVSRMRSSALIHEVWQSAWFRRAYIMSFVLQCFYAVMVVYMPLILVNQGFSVQQIGFIFTLILVPFVIIEYPAGILADMFFGEREMLIGGFLLMTGSLLTIVFMPPASAMAWIIVLAISRVGAALVESMSDVFFYKHVKCDDIGAILVYRTAYSTGLLVTMMICAIVLYFFPVSLFFPFAIMSAVTIIGVGVAWNIRDTDIVRK